MSEWSRASGETERYRTLLEINNALVANLTRDALFHAIAGALRRVVPLTGRKRRRDRMLRIVMVETEAETAVLHLEGQVIGPWVAELERVCEPILDRGGELHLDLSTVSFVSREGVELLSRLRDGHARLINCSRFVGEQLKAAGGGPLEGAAEDRA